MEPRENRYAVPLATLVAGAFVPATAQVVEQPVDERAALAYGGGGGDVDGDGE